LTLGTASLTHRPALLDRSADSWQVDPRMSLRFDMTFRITLTRSDEHTFAHIAGTVSAAAVEHLLGEAHAELSRLVIDLTEVRSIDALARSALVELRESGVELRGASPYVALLLESERAPDPARDRFEDKL